jgi:hypothetical protein
MPGGGWRGKALFAVKHQQGVRYTRSNVAVVLLSRPRGAYIASID